MDPKGFTAQDWDATPVFEGRCATPTDVEQGGAVFALAETVNSRPMELALPQPVIWYDDDAQRAALVLQAEIHETEAGETLEVLGLLLPNGRTAVGFMEDVEEVDGVDPVWLALIEAGDDGVQDDDRDDNDAGDDVRDDGDDEDD